MPRRSRGSFIDSFETTQSLVSLQSNTKRAPEVPASNPTEKRHYDNNLNNNDVNNNNNNDNY